MLISEVRNAFRVHVIREVEEYLSRDRVHLKIGGEEPSMYSHP